MRLLEDVRNTAQEMESAATDALSALGPWLAPIPSAALVARASVEHLGWSQTLGVVSGTIIEVLGLTATSTALTLWGWNESKRKSDPSAPFALAASLVGVYFASTVGLTVLLDITPQLARFAPAIFPTLALVGTVNLALRSQHKRRLAEVESVKLERKAKRQVVKGVSSDGKPDTLQLDTPLDTLQPDTLQLDTRLDTQLDTGLDTLQPDTLQLDTRLDALLTLYTDNPKVSATDAARTLGVSRQTIYTYNKKLEASGRLRKTTSGWVVV
jgi:hypothetical protein